MKKKKFALMGIAVLTATALASCTKDQPAASTSASTPAASTSTPAASTSTPAASTSTPAASTSTPAASTSTPVDRGRLDISLNYSESEGISYHQANSWVNAVDGVTYTTAANVLLPTWKAFAEKTNTTISDSSAYATKDNNNYNAVKNKEWKSENDNGQLVDLIFAKTSTLNSGGKSGEVVDLTTLINAGKMPYFEAWLAGEPAVKKQLSQANGAIYYTPYFDGYNDVERMLNMDTNIVRKLLDNANNGDTTGSNGGSAPGANLVQKAAYMPFIDANNNYATDNFSVDVVSKDGSKKEQIQVKQTTNIIKQQNELLTAGCTGKALLDQFKTYLTTAYGAYVGEGKLYTNLSDIFVSASAAYNVDELIALMRVVKANPGTITGDPYKEVECLFPRAKSNNRVDNIMDFAQVWGVQGLTAEKDMLYFAFDKTLNDAATTKATYDVLTQMGQIYAEGLILDEFWAKPTTEKSTGTEYLDKYWKKTTDDASYGLLMYDYSATQSVGNDLVDGIGTDASKRKIQYKSDGIMPILPPLTYWGNKSGWTRNDSLTDFSHKVLMRYSEENRALKDSSWAIPATSDNIDGAAYLMDYLFSPEGQRIQDFGPEAYWAGYNAQTGAYTKADLVAEEPDDPILSDATFGMLATTGKDFWSFMRDYLGATHGIGSIRSKTLQIVACNKYARVGAANLAAAISTGVVKQGIFKEDFDWGATVPTTYENTVNETDAKVYDDLSLFWKSDKVGKPNGWVAVIVATANGTITGDTEVVKVDTTSISWDAIRSADCWARKDKKYLFACASSLDETNIPAYCRTTA